MNHDSEKLADVLQYLEEVLAGMIQRPAMYGTPQGLEMEFLRLLEVKEMALGLRTMKDFVPVSRPDLILNQWIKFLNEKFPGTPGIYPLTYRREMEVKELSGYFAEFRARVNL